MICDAAIKYIDTPFAFGGRDSTSLDCVGLILVVIKEEYDIDIKVNYPASIQYDGGERWKEVFKKRGEIGDLSEGDAVLFSIRRAEIHFGIITKLSQNEEESMFVHANQSIGKVICQRLTNKWKSRIVGVFSMERDNIVWQH